MRRGDVEGGEMLVLLWAMDGDLELTLKKVGYALLGVLLVVLRLLGAVSLSG